MRRRFSIKVVALLALLLCAGVAAAQTASISQRQMDDALRDLSAVYGSPVVRADQAKAICNEEQYMLECAQIGKRHGLYTKERAAQVTVLIDQLKGDIAQKIKQCDSVDCLVGVATTLAQTLSQDDPALARTVDLTPQKVDEKRAVAAIAKSEGVSIEECQTMDPDEASVDLLRGCAKLAKNERMQRYIPQEGRKKVEKSDKMLELKEALARGELSCGDGTLDGCGNFCLNPSLADRQQGTAAIPPVCRDIATRFFGPEGVRDLERAYSSVQETFEVVKEDNFYPEDKKTQPRRSCPVPMVAELPCPDGEYRQESINEFGCREMSACIPFNTKTQPEPKEKDKTLVCPALATVESCRNGEEKVVAYTSPECGTYYSCRPTSDDRARYPHTFSSGRVMISSEEARTYCFESGGGGATARGDRRECEELGFAVPAAEANQCSRYGEAWQSIDESGNCFNPGMTEYFTASGVLRTCADRPVYGCGEQRLATPPTGQKEQVWNDRGLRSWVRADADAGRIESLKAACAEVRSQANVWTNGAGNSSHTDFGMPDPAKCKKAALCSATDYFNGSSCAPSTPETPVPSTPDSVSGSCSSELKTLLGSGCHSMGSAWFNSARSHYVPPGSSSLRSCSSAYIYGCSEGQDNTSQWSGSSAAAEAGCRSAGGTWDSTAKYCRMPSEMCPSGQYWNGSACATSSTPTTACGTGYTWDGRSCVSSGTRSSDGTYDYASAKAGCASAGGTWDTSANYCKMPNTGSSGSGSSSMSRCFYTNASRSGQPLGFSVWCESDYYNCHEGTSAGPSVSTTGLTLGAPSQCEGGWSSGSGSGGNVGSSGCASWEYWNGTMCVSSSGSSGSGSGGGCGMYTSMSTCVAMSACKWESNTCMYNTTGSSCSSGQYWNGSACVTSSSGDSSSSGSSSTSCGAGQYWDSRTNSCQSMQAACAEAGGTWSSSSNYCNMPSSGGSSGGSSGSTNYDSMKAGCASAGGTWDSTSNYCKMPSSYAPTKSMAFCPEGLSWNGGYCESVPSSARNNVANVLSAFLNLFGL